MCFLFFSNCKKEQTKNSLSKISHIDINNPLSISIDSLMTDIDTIQLEVSDSSLLGDVHLMHIMNDKLYILDSNNNAVFIFSCDGKLIRKIDRSGQGPLEYIRINSIEVDYQQKQLILSDSFSRRIFLFDEYGELLKVLNLEFIPDFIKSRNGEFLNFYSGAKLWYTSKEMENYNIHVLDSNGIFVSSFFENQIPKRFDIGSAHRINYNSKSDDIWFHPLLSDTIYRIDKNNLAHTEYVFRNKSNYKRLSPDERKKMSFSYGDAKNIQEKENKGYLLSWGSVLNLDDYFFFKMGGWNHPVSIYYDKATGKSITIDLDKLKGNKALIRIFRLPIRQIEGNYFYSSIHPIIVDEEVENLPDGKLKTFFQNNNTMDSNHLIIKYKIKFPEQ